MEVIFLRVVEVTVSLTKLRARAAPNATLLAVTVPSALVLDTPVWVADASTAPTVNKPLVPALPIVAVVLLFTIVRATVGLTDIEPPAPELALFKLALSATAFRVKVPAFVRVTLS